MEKRDHSQEALEKRIRELGDALDAECPRSARWEDIAARLDEAAKPAPRVRSLQWTSLLRAAVVLLFLGIAGWWLNRPVVPHPSGTSASAVHTGSEDSGTGSLRDPLLRDPRFAELHAIEAQYSRMEALQRRDMLQSDAISPQDAGQIFDLISDLESDYRQLREELQAGGDAATVLDAMIRNYRQRIDVLEQMNNLIQQPEESPREPEYASSIVL